MLVGMRTRTDGMVDVSPGRYSCHGSLQVVGLEEVVEASLRDCSLSDWEMVARIGNEAHPFVVRAVGSGNFRLCLSHVLCLVKEICGLLRASLFLMLLIALIASCPFLLVSSEPILGQPSLAEEGMMFVVAVGTPLVVDVSIVVVR